jgi:hypothetical protein
MSYWYGFVRIRGSTFLNLALVEDSMESWSRRSKFVLMTFAVLFFLSEIFWSFSHKVFNEATKCKCNLRHHVLFLHIFPTGFLRALKRHVLVVLFAQGIVLSNPSLGYVGKYRLCPWGVSHLYIRNLYTPSYDRDQKETRGLTLYLVSRVFPLSCLWEIRWVLQFLAPLLMTGENGVDLVIRGNVPQQRS